MPPVNTEMRETATRRRRSLLTLGACLAVSAFAAGCGGDDGGDKAAAKKKPAGPAAKTAATVDIAEFKYKPDPITVAAGGTVTWVNRDKAPHTAETDSGAAGAFNTGRLDKGQKDAVKFDDPGKFTYFCSFHRFMTGTVEVQAAQR